MEIIEEICMKNLADNYLDENINAIFSSCIS